MNRVAECCCGKLSIEVTGEPTFHGVCHCDNCKKRTGSAFGISTYFTKAQVVKKYGLTHCYAFHHKEQNHEQERHFCQGCGTTLFWTVSTKPDVIGIAGGCFIQTPLGEPTYSLKHNNKCSWLSLPEAWSTL